MNWAKNIPIPEYHAVVLVIGLGLHFWPFTELSFNTGYGSITAGIVLVASAVLITVWSVVSFGREASDQPSRLRTTGPYGISRNPMYLSWSLMILGLGFVVGSWWLLGAAALATAVTHFRVIPGEERFLAERFGDEYVNYQRQVPRWLWRL